MDNTTRTINTTTTAYTWTMLTKEQFNKLRVVHAKWKDVQTYKGDSMWVEFFNDNMEYTAKDIVVMAKYFNLERLLNATTGFGASDVQEAMGVLCATEVLDFVALERELLAISGIKEAIAEGALALHRGYAV